MHTGMLWFDNSKKPLEEKVKGAAEYFQKKHGKTPDLCLVNPRMFDDGHVLRTNHAFALKTESNTTIIVRPYRPVLPHHIWIGIEDKQS